MARLPHLLGPYWDHIYMNQHHYTLLHPLFILCLALFSYYQIHCGSLRASTRSMPLFSTPITLILRWLSIGIGVCCQLFVVSCTVNPATATLDWLTPLFSLITSCDRGINMGCFPLLIVELDDSEMQLENFIPALRY